MSVVREATYENGVLKPDAPLPLGDKQRVRITVQPLHDDTEAARQRRDLARTLAARVEQLLPSLGDVALAGLLQLLERDLAQAHEILGACPSERAFLSLVALLESACVVRTWKEHTRAHLEAMRDALQRGCQAGVFGAAEFEAARRRLRSAGVELLPRIDLGSLEKDDLTDEPTA